MKQWASSRSGRVVLWVLSVALMSIALNGLAEARRWEFWRVEAAQAITDAEARTSEQIAGIRAPVVALEGFWTVTLADGDKQQGLVGLRSGQVEVTQGRDVLKVPVGKVKSIVR